MSYKCADCILTESDEPSVGWRAGLGAVLCNDCAIARCRVRNTSELRAFPAVASSKPDRWVVWEDSLTHGEAATFAHARVVASRGERGASVWVEQHAPQVDALLQQPQWVEAVPSCREVALLLALQALLMRGAQ